MSGNGTPCGPGAGGRLQRPQRKGIVGAGIKVGQLVRTFLLDKYAAPGRPLHQAADGLVQQRLQRFIRGRRHFDKDGSTSVASLGLAPPGPRIATARFRIAAG